MYACKFRERGEGYWTSEKFVQQMKDAVKLVRDGTLCGQQLPADDSLDVRYMNAKPGGKQGIMRDDGREASHRVWYL